MLPVAQRIGELPPPFELLVMNVTDQGRRRPMKVARLVPLGSRSAVAELLDPKLVLFRGGELVLSGAESLIKERSTLTAAQTWVCKLSLPAIHAAFKVWTNHEQGVEIPRGRVLNTAPNVREAGITVGTVLHESLGRHTTQALVKGNANISLALMDAELEWMSEERFCLSGFQQHPEGAEWPARLLRQGWLCEHDAVVVPVPGQERMLRRMSQR
jgi:hypothetical protein